MTHSNRLATKDLRWTCEESVFDFETTENTEKESSIVGQEVALEALRYSFVSKAKGQNVYVRGLAGTGRMTAVMQMLENLSRGIAEEDKNDFCYVHNFSQQDKPRLLRLEPGDARRFRRVNGTFIDFIRDELPSILDGEDSQTWRNDLQEDMQRQLDELSVPFQEELAEKNMTLLPVNQESTVQQIIVPLIEGRAISPQEYAHMVSENLISKEQQELYKETHAYFMKELKKLNREAYILQQKTTEKIFEHGEQLVRQAMEGFVQAITSKFPSGTVRLFLHEVTEDVVEHVLSGKLHEVDLDSRYGVNVVLEQGKQDVCPVVVENSPSVFNLVGSVEPFFTGGQVAQSDYRGVRAGSILRASGGYLILDAKDLLMEPGSWRSLMRTLKTGMLEIVPMELGMYMPHMLIKPEPIPVRLRVILLGDAYTYYQLSTLDPDFSEQFKVLSDFDSEMEHTPQAIQQYASVVAYVVDNEGLLPFRSCAVAALCEYGVRESGHHSKLTTRFGHIADVVREAVFVAEDAQKDIVRREDVKTAIERKRERNMLPSRKFKELINRGTIIIQTQGDVVGQVNGLAVMSSGSVSFGFPARITATIGAGRAGIIDIEGRASMSGSIHTKGVNILGGLLRHLFQLDHPLAFSASLAFEQSYGGIDGDSASGAEACCLISALTNVPLKQSLAMTGAIDQHGHIQAIGGVNEKIEGFFDTCSYMGLTGDQGVIIPKSNSEALMLREDIVAAADQGKFHVYAVDTIYEALALFTGMDVMPCDEHGNYPEGSLLALAKAQATHFWKETLKSPAELDKEVAVKNGE